jgi:hypothetical protein
MKKWGILFGIFICLVLIYAISCKSPATSETAFPAAATESESSSSSQTSSSGGSDTTTAFGSLKLMLKDKPVEDAAQIWVTIDNIRVHKASPENFIVVLEEELPPIDLLALQVNPLTIVDGELGAGHYNQIRMRVVEGTIVFKEDPIGYEMKIPSNEIKIPVQFRIEENDTLQIILDFDAMESIKVTKQGKGKKEGEDTYTMRPVIKVEEMKKINNS